jgi:hypothetical protein
VDRTGFANLRRSGKSVQGVDLRKWLQEPLRVALVLIGDLIGQTRMNSAAIMGHKGGSATARKARLRALPPIGRHAQDAGGGKA